MAEEERRWKKLKKRWVIRDGHLLSFVGYRSGLVPDRKSVV